MEVDFTRLEERLSYVFDNKDLLLEALCHTSYVNERGEETTLKDNQRLEYLGDAVLNLVVAHLLVERFPRMKEGELSKTRSGLVSEHRLAECARLMGLGTFLLLGKGEIQTDGRNKSSVLADALEALMAAVYLDGGFDAARRLIESLFDSFINDPAFQSSPGDAKSRLQETVQQSKQIAPIYTILQETGPDHDKTFQVQVEVLGVTAQGLGRSKKSAEQDAAKNALNLLGAYESESHRQR